MITFRNSVFETNSSSTHSLCMYSYNNKEKPDYVTFSADCFGWENEVVSASDYLYTAILCKHGLHSRDDDCITEDDILEIDEIQRIKKLLEDNGIVPIFIVPRHNDFYIDHEEELGDFFRKQFYNDELLLNFILYGVVRCGNDNDASSWKDKKDLELMKNGYTEIYYKGN